MKGKWTVFNMLIWRSRPLPCQVVSQQSYGERRPRCRMTKGLNLI